MEIRIDATNGLSAVRPPIAAPRGALLFISASRPASDFSSKPLICPSASNRKMPIWVASAWLIGCAAMVMSAWLSRMSVSTSFIVRS